MQHSVNPVSLSRERLFTVNGIELAAQEWGEPGGLPVLALHGWLDNSASFFKLAPLLQGIHLVGLDLAGHGQSAHRPGCMAYTFWDDISDIFAVADALAWDKFVLLGHSRGAIIGTLAAGTFPERFLGLGLIEGILPEPMAAHDAPAQLASAITGLRAQQLKKPTIYPALDIAIKARERGMFPLTYEAAAALTMRGVIDCEGGYSWSTDPRLMAPSVFKMSQQQVTAFLARVQAPIKLLLAQKGLPKLYASYLVEVEKMGVAYELLEGGHHLHMEQETALVAEKLNQFFATLS